MLIVKKKWDVTMMNPRQMWVNCSAIKKMSLIMRGSRSIYTVFGLFRFTGLSRHAYSYLTGGGTEVGSDERCWGLGTVEDGVAFECEYSWWIIKLIEASRGETSRLADIVKENVNHGGVEQSPAFADFSLLFYRPPPILLSSAPFIYLLQQ